VTILAVPLVQLENVTLELYSEKGNLIAKSDSDKYINFIQLKARKGVKFKTVVYFEAKDQPLAGFRIFVVGSSEYLNMSNIAGPHISAYNPEN